VRPGHANVIASGADETAQAARADFAAVKEGVPTHSEVSQLLRQVRTEPAKADQHDASVCEPLLSRLT